VKVSVLQVEVLIGRGALQQQSEAYDRAEADFSAAVTLDPSNAQVPVLAAGNNSANKVLGQTMCMERKSLDYEGINSRTLCCFAPILSLHPLRPR
jgi:hypothetical protein